LGEIPFEDKKLEKVVMILSNTLSDPDPEVKAHAAGSLGKIGADAHSSTPLLIALLDDENHNVKKTAIDAISHTAGNGRHSAAAITALKKLKKKTNETSIRLAIKTALEKVNKETKQLKKKKKKEKS
jgi:HEAT repeat protein